MAFVDEGGCSSAVWAVVGQPWWYWEWLINKVDGVMQPAGRVRGDVPGRWRTADGEQPTCSLL
jgi:hypothetical protein